MVGADWWVAWGWFVGGSGMVQARVGLLMGLLWGGFVRWLGDGLCVVLGGSCDGWGLRGTMPGVMVL